MTATTSTQPGWRTATNGLTSSSCVWMSQCNWKSWTSPFSQNPRPTFIAVAPEPLPEPLPPEPEDLRVILLVCCGEDVKAQWDWDGALYCPRCGAHHGGLSGRQQVHLEFIQE